jgi:hypothetical protein
MKHKLITNACKLLLLSVVAGLFAGYAATRPISDVALGAGGAYLGHELSNGDPLATAAGAAGGVIISETLHYAAKKQAEKAYSTGYDKGKSDAVKQSIGSTSRCSASATRSAVSAFTPCNCPNSGLTGERFNHQPNCSELRSETTRRNLD